MGSHTPPRRLARLRAGVTLAALAAGCGLGADDSRATRIHGTYDIEFTRLPGGGTHRTQLTVGAGADADLAVTFDQCRLQANVASMAGMSLPAGQRCELAADEGSAGSYALAEGVLNPGTPGNFFLRLQWAADDTHPAETWMGQARAVGASGAAPAPAAMDPEQARAQGRAMLGPLGVLLYLGPIGGFLLRWVLPIGLFLVAPWWQLRRSQRRLRDDLRSLGFQRLDALDPSALDDEPSAAPPPSQAPPSGALAKVEPLARRALGLLPPCWKIEGTYGPWSTRFARDTAALDRSAYASGLAHVFSRLGAWLGFGMATHSLLSAALARMQRALPPPPRVRLEWRFALPTPGAARLMVRRAPPEGAALPEGFERLSEALIVRADRGGRALLAHPGVLDAVNDARFDVLKVFPQEAMLGWTQTRPTNLVRTSARAMYALGVLCEAARSLGATAATGEPATPSAPTPETPAAEALLAPGTEVCVTRDDGRTFSGTVLRFDGTTYVVALRNGREVTAPTAWVKAA